MAFKIVYKSSVLKDLARMDKSEARRILNKIEEILPARAETFPALKGDFAGMRKFRFGDYRIIFIILGDEVQVLQIGNRKEIYR